MQDFIIRAKAACYVGGGAKAAPSRPGAHDLTFAEGDLTYRDSYFGGTDFLGQEVVWSSGRPIWAMNYYGRILRDDLIDGAQAGAVIKAALSALYAQDRFLGQFDFAYGGFDYTDTSTTDWRGFTGQEQILLGRVTVYRLEYHGGLIRD